MKKQMIIIATMLSGFISGNIDAQKLQLDDLQKTDESHIESSSSEANPSSRMKISFSTPDSLGMSYEDFEQKVLDYSQTLKQSVAQQIAMKKAMQIAKTGFLPSVDANGGYQYRINDYEMPFGEMAVPMKHDSYSAGVTVMQPVYAGGSVIANYKAQSIQSEISALSTELTKDNVIYAAENSYWKASAQKEMYDIMCKYTDIVNQLLTVLEDRYKDGMISKTDLIQMQVRHKDAEVQRLNTLEQYKLSIQNMNILMGKHPEDSISIAEPISSKSVLPTQNNLETAMNARPDYGIARLNVDFKRNEIRRATAKYNPSLSVGFQGVWGTQMLNIDGDTKFNSTLLVSLKIPLFHWGARFKTKAAQKALWNQSRFALQDKQDQISKELAKSWTNVTESLKRIDLAEDNCTLADENLELNTFSYTEGKLSILDVLSAQLTWIQAYTTLVQSHYQQKIAQADYMKASGARYLK